MRKVILLLFMSIVFCSVSIFAKGKISDMSSVENFGYVSGYKTAESFSQYIESILGQGSEKTAVNAFMKGIKAYLKGEKISEEKQQELIEPFKKKVDEINASKQEDDMANASENLMKAEDFLNQNRTKPGVIETSSRLQYEILQEGTGEVVGDKKDIVVNYKMCVFTPENVIDQNENIDFNLDYLIKGAQEGIALMNVGAKYRFYIHPDLGYGMSTVSDALPGGSLLIFDVELLQIK